MRVDKMEQVFSKRGQRKTKKNTWSETLACDINCICLTEDKARHRNELNARVHEPRRVHVAYSYQVFSFPYIVW